MPGSDFLDEAVGYNREEQRQNRLKLEDSSNDHAYDFMGNSPDVDDDDGQGQSDYDNSRHGSMEMSDLESEVGEDPTQMRSEPQSLLGPSGREARPEARPVPISMQDAPETSARFHSAVSAQMKRAKPTNWRLMEQSVPMRQMMRANSRVGSAQEGQLAGGPAKPGRWGRFKDFFRNMAWSRSLFGMDSWDKTNARRAERGRVLSGRAPMTRDSRLVSSTAGQGVDSTRLSTAAAALSAQSGPHKATNMGATRRAKFAQLIQPTGGVIPEVSEDDSDDE